jgi:hypothetical protein
VSQQNATIIHLAIYPNDHEDTTLLYTEFTCIPRGDCYEVSYQDANNGGNLTVFGNVQDENGEVNLSELLQKIRENRRGRRLNFLQKFHDTPVCRLRH